jgi:iduronate 2-sulfatase
MGFPANFAPLALLFAWVAPVAAEPAAAPARKLNVLFIVADDLNNDLGCYGHAVVKSPHIDRLAARAVRFDRAYCNYPVCNPSRTSLLSGKRPVTTGVVDNVTPTRAHLKDAVMLPQLFRQNGWSTHKVGKIYHTGAAFEDPPSWDSDLRETSEAKKPPKEQIVKTLKGSGKVLNAEDADTWDGKVARTTVELMEKAVQDGTPFFLAAGFRRPHTPYIAPQKYYDLYPTAKMTWASEPAAHLAGIPPLALTYPPGKPGLPENERAEVISSYYASVSFMDAQVGVLLDAMDRLKLWDRTVVVFVSDHGYHLGEHGGLWHKMTLFEESARVPLIVSAPGAKRGAVSKGLVELVDLYPTLAELCGVKAPGDLEGLSFRPLLENPERPWKTGAFTVVGRLPTAEKGGNSVKLDVDYLGRSVRTDRWRYTEWPDGAAELYDEESDPREYVNLAGQPEAAARRAELKALLAAGWKGALPK